MEEEEEEALYILAKYVPGKICWVDDAGTKSPGLSSSASFLHHKSFNPSLACLKCLSLPSLLLPPSCLVIQNPRKPTFGFPCLWLTMRYLMNLVGEGVQQRPHVPHLVPWA